MMWSLTFPLFDTILFLISVVTSDEYVSIPNSCRGLEDGSYVLKLLSDEDAPLVTVECSNEFMLIDVSKEENFKKYFSSHIMWHYEVMGPTNEDHVNWHDWWLPSSLDDSSEQSFEFLFSETCETCDEISTGHYANTPDDEGYVPYLTGNMFSCFWTVRGIHDYDYDFDSNTCYYHISGTSDLIDDTFEPCEPVASSDYTYDEIHSYPGYLTGACPTFPLSPSYTVATYHDDCANAIHEYYFKPSIGTDGRNCVCVKPSEDYSNEYDVLESDYNSYLNEYEMNKNKQEKEEDDDEENEEDSSKKMVYLYQDDFAEGTYRILESGTYIIMEDIVFDFNSGTGNEIGAWLPHNDQANLYPGAEDNHWRDPYFMGFFAGITVECDNVVIDLNGKTLSQSIEFYYQQRWFSLIELSSQPFLASQGPGFFGPSPVFSSNVEIFNGRLGLTAHHGIHGNGNKNVFIHDVEVFDFETHGIQLNGFEDVVLENIKIHDSSRIAFLRAEYGHARQILPRLKQLIDTPVSEYRISQDKYQSLKYNADRKSIRFAKGAFKNDENSDDSDDSDNDSDSDFLQDVYEDMISQMNMAFEYVLDMNKNDAGIDLRSKWSDNSEDWNDRSKYDLWMKTKETFLYMYDEDDDVSLTSVDSNTNGLPFGSVTYGIFLTYPGANVLAFGNCNSVSSNVKISNIEIYGLRHKMHEYLRIGFLTNPFNALIDMSTYFSDVEDFSNSYYVGNVMTDAYAALDYITNDWGILQMMDMSSNYLAQFALGVRSDTGPETQAWELMCNADAMSHSGKGTIGIRLDSIDEFEISNVHIYDLYDYTKQGSQLCGEYTTKERGHFLQTSPIQYGFSGNMVHGINIMGSTGKLSNINVHDIGSASGLAHGISVYGVSDVTFNDNIEISNVVAGFQIDVGDLSWDDAPSRAPEACGVYVYWMNDQSTAPQGMTSSSITISTDDEDKLKIDSQCVRGHVGCFNEDFYGGTMIGTYTSCQDEEEEVEAEDKTSSKNNLAVSEEFRNDIDLKLLSLKDTSGDLVDFDSDLDGISFDDSVDLYITYHMGIDESGNDGMSKAELSKSVMTQMSDSHDSMNGFEFVCIVGVIIVILVIIGKGKTVWSPKQLQGKTVYAPLGALNSGKNGKFRMYGTV